MGALTGKYIEKLGYEGTSDFAEDLFRNSWSKGYPRWRILKEEFAKQGWDLSTEEGYQKYLDYCGIAFNMPQFTDQAMQIMGIEEITDIPTLGHITQHVFSDLFLCPSEILEEGPDRAVVRALWCGNPAYGPAPYGTQDSICNYHEYYRLFDAGLTRDLALAGIVAAAKDRGLKEEVEWEMPWAMCRDGDAPFCIFVYKKKGLPPYELPSMTDRDKTWFINHQIDSSDKNTMEYVAQMLGKTTDELVESIFVLYVALDMGGYVPAEVTFGPEKAIDMYRQYWQTLLYHWFREAKVELEIGKVESIDDLAEIIRFCEARKYIPYDVSKKDNQIILTSSDDPFFEVATQVLGLPADFGYISAIADADNTFIEKIVEDAKMQGKAKVTVTKKLAKGDDSNEIMIEAI